MSKGMIFVNCIHNLQKSIQTKAKKQYMEEEI